MRIWCDGVPLGNYSNQHCGLPASSLQELAQTLPNLWDEDFNGLSDADLFRHLDSLLYGYVDGIEVAVDRTLEQCVQDGEKYGQFIFLTNWGEMFDGAGKAFILCPDGNLVKLLHESPNGAPCSSLVTTIESVQDACREFEVWFKQQTKRLRS